jgi:hypothetical protein
MAIVPDMSEAIPISAAISLDMASNAPCSDADCGIELNGAADPAAGSIATDRAIIRANIVRTKRIAALSTYPLHIVPAGRAVKFHRSNEVPFTANHRPPI